MKLIDLIITDCGECPYNRLDENDIEKEMYCSLARQLIYDDELENGIPNWCELDDYEHEMELDDLSIVKYQSANIVKGKK